MKRTLVIAAIFAVFVSCNSVDDHVFTDSEEIEKSALDLLGNQLARAFQDQNREQIYRHVDKELVRSCMGDALEMDLNARYEQTQANAFLEESIDYLIFDYSDIRKYKYLGTVNGTGNRIAISVIHDDEESIYEFLVTDYNNSLKVYDIYYPQIGYKLSESSIVQFNYSNQISYMAQSSMYDLSSEYLYEDYEDYIESYEELYEEDQDHPWILGNYIQSLFATNNANKTIRSIESLPDFNDLIRNRYYQWYAVDSLKKTTESVINRYGKNSFTRIFSMINRYYAKDRNIDQLAKEFETELLKENDHADLYLYLVFLKIEQNKYRDAVKFLDIIHNKFQVEMSVLNDQLVNFDDFLVSEEYRNWRKF